MKTKELIGMLLSADPIGEAEVLVGPSTDIQFVERTEWHYDGYPHLLLFDKDDFVDGIKIISEPDTDTKYKVIVHTLSVEDVLLDNHNAIVTVDKKINNERRLRLEKYISNTRKKMKKIHKNRQRKNH